MITGPAVGGLDAGAGDDRKVPAAAPSEREVYPGARVVVQTKHQETTAPGQHRRDDDLPSSRGGPGLGRQRLLDEQCAGAILDAGLNGAHARQP
jgi:hypothetical protein